MSEIVPLVADETPLPDLVSVLVASGDLFFTWDLVEDRMAWSGQTSAVVGVSDGAVLRRGEAFLKRVHPEDLPHRMLAVSRHLDHGAAIDCEYRVRGDDGEFRWINERTVARKAADGRAVTLTGVVRNVDGQKANEQQLRFLTTHDALTGQFNRVRLREALQHAINASLSSGGHGGFLLVGVDKLAMLGDVHGEDVVDTVLLNLARRIEQCLRGGDVVGRVGFDRFAVILPRCSEGQTYQVAGRILATVREAPVATENGNLHITASAGATVFPGSAKTAREAVSQADAALRNAYRLGCDCFSDYRDVPQAWLANREDLDVADQVQRAIRENRIVLAYQPVVDARSGAVAFYECLARMVGEDGKLVPAAAFVPIVEQMGLMRLIDRRVLDLGVTTLMQHPDLQLSINVSGLTVIDPQWLRMACDRLVTRDDVAKRLTLEITETVALDDIAESSAFVKTLGELGCRVALDDFGAGFTSFRHLRALDVDMIKIDGSFVRNLSGNPDNQIFLRALLDLAAGIGVSTVAECVETEQEIELLRGQGVDYVQGYYLGQPSVKQPWVSEDEA